MTLKAPVLLPDHEGSEYNYKKHLLLLEKPCWRCKLANNKAREIRRQRYLQRRGPRDHHDDHCRNCGAFVSLKNCKNCGLFQ